MAEPWEVHEAFVNEVLGLSGTPGSGSQWHSQGDGVDNRHPDDSFFPLLVDCKCTQKASFSIKLKTLTQWRTTAWELGKRFIMPIRFHDRGARRSVDYVLLELNDFVELLEMARDRSAPGGPHTGRCPNEGRMCFCTGACRPSVSDINEDTLRVLRDNLWGGDGADG